MASDSSRKSSSSASSRGRSSQQPSSGASGARKLDRKNAGYYASARANTQPKAGRAAADAWRNPQGQPRRDAQKPSQKSAYRPSSAMPSNVTQFPKRGTRPVPSTLDGFGDTRARTSSSRQAAQGKPHRTVRDIREQERKAAARAMLKKRILKAAIVVAAICAVIAGFFAVRNSQLFEITSVSVEGGDYLTNDEISALAGIQSGDTLLRVDTQAIKTRLSSSPWIASVDVKLSFPDTIVLEVTERKIAATVEVPINAESSVATKWVIASDGTWLAQVDENLLADANAASTDAAAATTTTASSTADSTAPDTSAETVDEAAAQDTSDEQAADSGSASDAAATDDAADSADQAASDAAATDEAAAQDSGTDEGAVLEEQSYGDEQVSIASYAPASQSSSTDLTLRPYALADTTATEGSATLSSSGTAFTTAGSSTTSASTTASTAANAETAKEAAQAELARRVAADSLKVPTITDISTLAVPSAGTAATDGGILAALAVLSGISDDLYSQVVSASAPNENAVTLTLSDGVLVSFGSSSDISTKERIVLDLLAQHAGQVSYINVRVPDRPAWRGLS